MNTEEFIEKARKIHGDKYDYSKVNYVNKHTKVCIICPEHGEFWQTPEIHFKGCGCKICTKNKIKQKLSYTTEIFIKKAREIHGDKYDYSKVNYVNWETKICIICPKHGEFWQRPSEHLKGRGCKRCGDEKVSEKNKKTTTNSLIEKFISVWKNDDGYIPYDYNEVVFNGWHNKVKIFCKKHNHFFEILPGNHIIGQGCRDCMKDKLASAFKKDFQTFLAEAKAVHGDKYTYDETTYRSSVHKLKIICPEHGEFWQRACYHTSEQCGCPKCNESKLEREVSNLLIENNISFDYQKTFGWLKFKNKMQLDFYLPTKKIAIECQGEQHFKPIEYWGGEKSFKLSQNRDETKRKLCEEHGIRVLYYSDRKYVENLITNKSDLLNEIKGILAS